MERDTVTRTIRWSCAAEPAVRPGQIFGPEDARRASAPHVLDLGDRLRMYYWGTGEDGWNRICYAESPCAEPNAWRAVGIALERQPENRLNHVGPSFPFVVPSDDGPWLMYPGAWGMDRPDGRLPNTTLLALSDDGGQTWRYHGHQPIIPMDRPWDCEGTGSVCVMREDGLLRMYYTSLGPYFDRPEGVQTGHGDVIPRIGVGYAESRDGITWDKPVDGLIVAPRGFDTEPYEYISSKPFIVREGAGYRMWVGTFGTAYRIRSLVSADGLHWNWVPSGPDGDFGVGEHGAFDDHQRSYTSVLRYGDEYRCWYTGNGFGVTGIGYAVGRVV